MSREWQTLCIASHFPVRISLCLHAFEASAPPLLSSAIVLRMCGYSTLYLGVRGIWESREGHWENVNELNESADPNVGCALSYIKAMFQQKRIRQSVDISALKVTVWAQCVVPRANKMIFFLNTKTKMPVLLVLNDPCLICWQLKLNVRTAWILSGSKHCAYYTLLKYTALIQEAQQRLAAKSVYSMLLSAVLEIFYGG